MVLEQLSVEVMCYKSLDTDPALARLSDDVFPFVAEAEGACTAVCLRDTATALLLNPPRHQPGHGR